jgi:hypothetical protein
MMMLLRQQQGELTSRTTATRSKTFLTSREQCRKTAFVTHAPVSGQKNTMDVLATRKLLVVISEVFFS